MVARSAIWLEILMKPGLIACLLLTTLCVGASSGQQSSPRDSASATGEGSATSGARVLETSDLDSVVSDSAPTGGCSMLIESEPVGASVIVAGAAGYKKSGTTPLSLQGLSPATYRVRVTMPGFSTVQEALALNDGDKAARKYILEHVDTVGARASAQSTPPARPSSSPEDSKARMKTARICAGVLGVASLIAGFVIDQSVQKGVAEDNSIREEYWRNANESQYQSYNDRLTANSRSTKNQSVARNIFYGVGGLCVVGICISFAF
jgi:hypothetical protein